MDAGMLSCPACGGPATRDQTACDYCRAQLQTVACAQCLGRIFVGARHCSHCGAAVESSPSVEMGALDCPRCRHALSPCDVGQTHLEECGRCGGLWVEVQTLRALLTDRERRASFPWHGGPPRSQPNEAKVQYIPCPVCQQLMNRINYARISGVIIDVCRDHGSWFDVDELHRVVSFVDGGGLDRAREVELSRLREERRRLEEAQRQASAGSSGLTGPVTSSADLALFDLAEAALEWILKY